MGERIRIVIENDEDRNEGVIVRTERSVRLEFSPRDDMASRKASIGAAYEHLMAATSNVVTREAIDAGLYASFPGGVRTAK